MIVASPRPVQAVSELPPLLRLSPDDLQMKAAVKFVAPIGNANTINTDTDTDTDSLSQNNSSGTNTLGTAVCQNGVTGIPPPLPLLLPGCVPSASSSSLMSGETESPPPRYTRFSTSTFIYPSSSHAPRPSTSSTSTSASTGTVTGVPPSSASMSSSSCSTSTTRPSFESFTTPSDHGLSQSQSQSQSRGQQEQKKFQIMQSSRSRSGAAFQAQHRHPHPPSSPAPEGVQLEPGQDQEPELDNAPSYESSFRDTNLSGLPEAALTALSLARENLSDLQRASFFAGYNLDDLDRSDDRADPDSIIQRRLTHNALLSRQSAITLGSASVSSGSVYSEPETVVSPGVGVNEARASNLLSTVLPQPRPLRDSVYSTVTATSPYGYENEYENDYYDPLRVSVQTYGSSVLTYGSRASQLINIDGGGGGGGDHHFSHFNNSFGNSGSGSGFGFSSSVGGGNDDGLGGGFGGNGSGSDGGRPVAPLPWLPRPSALDRIQHCGGMHAHVNKMGGGRARSGSVGSNNSNPNSASGSSASAGRRPLPPLPTPISASASGNKPSPPPPTTTTTTMTATRDRSVSLPTRSSPFDSSSSSSANVVGGPRRPRPLPRTPSAAISMNVGMSSNLPDILEVEGQASDSDLNLNLTDNPNTNMSMNMGMNISGGSVPPSSGPTRSNSMFLSPTSATSTSPTSPLNFRGRRSSGAASRYSTIGYGHAARVGMRGVFARASNENNNENESGLSSSKEVDENNTNAHPSGNTSGTGIGKKPYTRAASRASTRSARSTFLVPDVDELVRILDSMDDSPGSGSSSGSGSGSSAESCLTTPLAWSGSGSVFGAFGNGISGTRWKSGNGNGAKGGERKFEGVVGEGEDGEGEGEDDGEEEIDMGEALACSRSVVNVPYGEKRSAAAALEDLRIGVSMELGLGTGMGIGTHTKSSSSSSTTVIGLPTPAATPRNSPHRPSAALPGTSNNNKSKSKSSLKTPPPPTPPPKQQLQPQPLAPLAPPPPPPPPLTSSSQAQSPSLTLSDADALSLTSFPLPPIAPLFIPAPSAVGASEMPIPSASSTGVPPSPSLMDLGKSPAERAVLPGMSLSSSGVKHDEVAHWKHITAREAIADLKHRVAELPKFSFPSSSSVKNKGIVKKFPSSGVPLLGFPVPPRRRAQSTSTSTSTSAFAPTQNNGESGVGTNGTNGTKKHAFAIPPAIDVRAANALPPPSSYPGLGFGPGRITPVSNSAPPNNQVFELEKPTIIYATPDPVPVPLPVPISVPVPTAQPPSVAPLKIRRMSHHLMKPTKSKEKEKEKANGRAVPPVLVPQSADAARTSFNTTAAVMGKESDGGRAPRATSFYASPESSSPTSVAPLRLKTTKTATRARSATVGAVPSLQQQHQQQQNDEVKENNVNAPVVERKSSETDGSEESESDQLTTPTAPNALLPDVVEAHASDDDNEKTTRGHQHRTISSTAGFSIFSSNNANNSSSSFGILHQSSTGAQTHISLDPAFADIIKSMAGASEEEQMGSLLTIASSINTEHHSASYNSGYFVPVVDESRTREDDGFVDIDDEGVNGNVNGNAIEFANAGANDGGLGRKETVRKSTASGFSVTSSINERRKSKSRSIVSTKKRHSTRSAAAVRAAIRALPDPNTFPIPTPDSGGSVATDLSAQAGGADYSRFGLRPSPLPKLRVVTKFKGGGAILLPVSSAPLSAASTKSTMSIFTGGGSGHSRNGSAVSIVAAAAKRVSSTTVGTGTRKMNRLTLTDPRSPMGEAAVAAAALVARVRQKRAALAAASRNQMRLRSALPGASPSAGKYDTAREEEETATQHVIHVITRGHARTGSGSSATQTLRSKLKMSGGSFFGGSTVRTRHNSATTGKNRGVVPSPSSSPSPTSARSTPDSGSHSSSNSPSDEQAIKIDSETGAGTDAVLRSGPRVQRPAIRRVRRARTSVLPAKSIELDLGV